MIRRPPRSTPTAPLLPYTTRVRSQARCQTAARIGQNRARADRARCTVETVADEIQSRRPRTTVFEANVDLGLGASPAAIGQRAKIGRDRKSTRLNSSH